MTSEYSKTLGMDTYKVYLIAVAMKSAYNYHKDILTNSKSDCNQRYIEDICTVNFDSYINSILKRKEIQLFL